MTTRFGIIFIIVAIAWFLVFLKSMYIGIATALVAVIWFFVFLKKKQDQVEARFTLEFGDRQLRKLDKHAVLRAQESRRYAQAQGQGYLVLTDDALQFDMVLLDNRIRIPVRAISGVEKTRRVLGVSPGRQMLKVSWKKDDGSRDALAFTLKDLDGWIEAIAKCVEARRKIRDV